jgi:hypothetical protein
MPGGRPRGLPELRLQSVRAREAKRDQDQAIEILGLRPENRGEQDGESGSARIFGTGARSEAGLAGLRRYVFPMRSFQRFRLAVCAESGRVNRAGERGGPGSKPDQLVCSAES